jgi:hypothetical protein
MAGTLHWHLSPADLKFLRNMQDREELAKQRSAETVEERTVKLTEGDTHNG